MSSARLGPFTIQYSNSEEYHRLKQEVFTQDSYYFESDKPDPVIIDAGAHIGISTLYFKRLFPGAQIIAIEPLPANFELLEKNIWDNQVTEVETHQVALAARGQKAEFYFDATPEVWYSTASFTPGAWTRTQSSQSITVPTQPLSDFLSQPVDLLKMDIEGAEEEVLYEARDSLHHVHQMWIEFHPLPHQSLPRITKFLTDHNFTLEFWQKGKQVPKPKTGLLLIRASQA